MGKEIQEVFREYMQLERRRDRDALSLAELRRWAELKLVLNRHFQPDVSTQDADRRDSIRVPTRLELRYDSLGQIGECLMTNLSRGGVFVATDTPLAIGCEVQLRIWIEEASLEIEVPGQVVSHHTGADLKSEETGMGVRFARLTDEQRKAVDELYQRAAQRAVGSGG